MKALRRIGLAALLAVTALVSAGCGVSKVRDIKLESAGVKYLVPTSAKSLDAVLLLEIDNPAMSFTVQDVTGDIRFFEQTVASFLAGPIALEKKSRQVYELPCTLTLDPSMSFLSLLALVARNRTLDGFKADINLYVANKNGTLKAPLTFKDMDLSQFTR